MSSPPRYVDSHAHLSLPDAFDDDRDEALARAREAGVDLLLDLATRPEDAQVCADFADANDGVYAAVGIHPHEASSWSVQVAADLRRLAALPKVVAIGEVGLDYHYNLSPPDVQRLALREQLQLAGELGLPVSVHSREAEEDTVRLLADSDVRRTGGVLHCFTGSEGMARKLLDLGMHISFSGIVTFANADPLRAIAASVPEDRLLVETDAPYLTPVPHRGKRNEPAFVVDVAACVARARGTSPEQVGRATAANFCRLFLAG